MRRHVFPLVVVLLVALPLIAHESKKYKMKIGDQTLIVELEELHDHQPQPQPQPQPEPQPQPQPQPEPPPHPHPVPEPTPAPQPQPTPDPHHGHDVEITDTHIRTAHETVPRFAAGAEAVAVRSGNWSDAATWRKPPVPGDRVQIPAGVNVSYDVRTSAGVVEALEVGGSLSFSQAVDTQLVVGELTVLPSGSLVIAPGDRRAEIVFRDGKLRDDDTTQAGRGLLVFGSLEIAGRPMARTFARLSGDVEAGADTISLRDAVDWTPGSLVAFPDTRQTNPVSNKYYTYQPQQEIRMVRAVDVDGGVITLDRPLKFNHRSPYNMDGTPVIGFDGRPLSPHVACLTRSVVLRSENPEGVRGHVQLFGSAQVSIRYAEFRDLGRTKPGPLNEANRIGRYSIHAHHLTGRPGGIGGHQYIIEGNSVVGGLKWGLTIHASHYGLVRGNVVYDVDGAGIATENGSEIGNVFEGNFVAKINGTDAKVKPWNGLGEQNEGDLGDQGDGFWFAGPMNTVRGNVVANAQRSAYTVWPDGMPHHPDSRSIRPVQAPVSPLGPVRTFNLLAEQFDKFDGNEAYGATTSAIQMWSVGDRRLFPGGPMNRLRNTTVWHVTGIGLRFYYADSCIVDGWLQRGDPAMLRVRTENGGADYPSRGEAVTHSGSVGRWSETCRVDIQGCEYGYIQRGHGFTNRVELCDAVLDNPINIEILNWAQQPSDSIYERVLFRDSYSPGSLKAIRMAWEPFSAENAVTPETHTVIGYQQIQGLDLDLYFHEQSPAVKAAMVPDGLKPKGRYAPTREIDGDDGQAAAARGRAMGIDGLVFVTAAPDRPLVFANALMTDGKPFLHYAVIVDRGDLGRDCKVIVTVDGRNFELTGPVGRVELDARPGPRRVKVVCNLGAERVMNVRLPIR